MSSFLKGKCGYFSYRFNERTKVKDKTEIYKLLAQKEIAMPPLKVVGVTDGNKAGWHFVKI